MKNITITKIEELYTVVSPKGRYFEMKERPCFGLSFCMVGQITYTHNGKTYISDPDHAILLPKGQSYTLHGDKKGRFPVIDFQCIDFDCKTFQVIPLQNKESFIKDYEHLKSLFLHSEHRLKTLGLFYEILERLTAQSNDGSGYLHPALHYLEEHIADPLLSNALLAKQAGISEVYFRKLFLQQYGTTPKQYILELRLRKAKQLLTDTAHSVTAVAEECGFSSVYHFCRIFKEKTGSTPKEYIRQTKNIGI
ncbi:MAG: helix-turn-helix transcriptional regulator [Clostridia bacterium]|nr:helix-turn-helix transcriptional regulator [Clostridia bacterium]